MTEAELEKLARSIKYSYGTEIQITDYSNCTEKFFLFIHSPAYTEMMKHLAFNVTIYDEMLRFHTILDEWYIIPMSNVKRIIIKK